MAIRQTRIFVQSNDPSDDWAETLIGRVFRQIVSEFAQPLQWFWFSRYICPVGMNGDDRGDCDFNAIPDDYQQAIPGMDVPGHRSLRFRFEITDADQAAFEFRLRQLLDQHEYKISDIRDYEQVSDTGGQRFLGVENRQPGRDVQRARLVTHLYQIISEIVIDSLVGPDSANRYRIEHNDLHQQNPNGSSFESLHHLFCNITRVPLSILFSGTDQMQLEGTFWGPPGNLRRLVINGKEITEVYVPY